MQEIGQFDVKVSVVRKGLEKNTAFTINKNLVFIDSMQFMNFSLDSLVKNLSDNDFKFLSQECTGQQLKLVKQKGLYPHEYIYSFKKFSKYKLRDRSKFFSCLNDKSISEKDYLYANNAWNMLKKQQWVVIIIFF